MRKRIAALLLLAPTLSHAQDFRSALVETKPKSGYSAIEFMSAAESRSLPGQKEDAAAETPRTRTLRLVVYRSEASQSVDIETLTTGLEGCCSRLARTQKVDLQGFANHFGFKGEVGQFKFAAWTSADSFRFTYDGKPFIAKISAKEIRFNQATGR